MNYRALLEARFLPFVIRPARYVGNEWGAVHKTAALRLALAVPDKYDRAMAASELHRLYRALNALPNISCERVFAPDLDAERQLVAEGLTLFTLESYTPVAECDWLHFLLSDPLQFTALLTMLKSAGLPLRSAARDSAHPVISASIAPSVNPEPIADYLDFIFVGDIDCEIESLQNLVAQRGVFDRRALSEQLAQIPGVYLPSLYSPQFAGDKYSGLKAVSDRAPQKIRARQVEKSQPRLALPILPFEEISSDRLDIVLGSSVDVDRSVQFIEQALRQTGYDEVALHGDLVAGIRNFDPFLTRLSQRLRERQVTIALPALPPVAAAIDYQRAVTFGEKSSIRFALLSGSERLREAHGHYVGLDQFYQVLANAFASGWRTARLDFEIGLPDETSEDIEATISVIRNCDAVRSEYGGKYQLHVTLAPFVPAPHSEWQWDVVISPEEYQARCERIQKAGRGKNIQFRVREAGAAYLRALLSRGDRRMSGIVEFAHDSGARFDGWSEHFNLDLWHKAFAQSAIPVPALVGKIPESQALPWEHLEFAQSKEQLLKRRATAFAAQPAGRSSSGFKLGDLILAKPELAEQIMSAPEPTTPTASFGRKPKRAPVQAVAMVVPRSRVRVQWRKDEPARFVGHLATMRMFERALRRADIPVSFSQGHHPRPRVSFGPPLAVGFTSRAEYFDLQLESPYQESMLERLNEALPLGFAIVKGRTVFGKAASVSSQLNLACYEVELPEGRPIDQALVNSLLDRSEIVVERVKGEDRTQFDIRPAIIHLELRATGSVNRLYMETALGNRGFVRPDEVLINCLGLAPREVLSLRICRTDLIVLLGNSRQSPFEVSG